MRSKDMDDCGGCICLYCRWHGSENCGLWEQAGSCLRCLGGSDVWPARRKKTPLFSCGDYTRPVVVLVKKTDADGTRSI